LRSRFGEPLDGSFHIKKNMKTKPKVGQKLFLSKNSEVLEVTTVVKVGRVYFYCRPDSCSEWQEPDPYYLEDWLPKGADASAPKELYESRQEWEDEKEGGVISYQIFQAFRHGVNIMNVPLNSLREIWGIIESKK